MATAGEAERGELYNQTIRMSAMFELKEISGREKSEERARNWISEVESAFLRDQAPEVKKGLEFSDLLTRPARD